MRFVKSSTEWRRLREQTCACSPQSRQRCGGIASEPVVRRLGHELLQVLPVAVLDALADVGGADGAARDGEARDDAALDADLIAVTHFLYEVECRAAGERGAASPHRRPSKAVAGLSR